MALAEREVTALNIIDSVNMQTVVQTMQKISQFQAVVKSALKEGHDYGVIPGTDKPTLLKPGAEKILMLMGITSEYDVIDKVQDYENGFFAFTVKCTLLRGNQKITEGLGAANTKEARYMNRWVTEKKIPEGIDKSSLATREKESKFKKGDTYTEYLVENSDGCTLANTVLKMGKKRSQVDAALTVASLSDLFTQDLEDLSPAGEPIKPTGNEQQRPAQQPQGKPAQQKPASATTAASNGNKLNWTSFWARCHEIGFNKEKVNLQASVTFNLKRDGLPYVPDNLVDNKHPENSIIKTQEQFNQLTRAIEDAYNIEQFKLEVEDASSPGEWAPTDDLGMAADL